MKRIIYTEGIDLKDPEIKAELDIDLRRMDRMKHEEAPGGAEAYRVLVRPSLITYYHGLHRFRFDIQYGKLSKGKFKPLGKLIETQSEALPMT